MTPRASRLCEASGGFAAKQRQEQPVGGRPAYRAAFDGLARNPSNPIPAPVSRKAKLSLRPLGASISFQELPVVVTGNRISIGRRAFTYTKLGVRPAD